MAKKTQRPGKTPEGHLIRYMIVRADRPITPWNQHLYSYYEAAQAKCQYSGGKRRVVAVKVVPIGPGEVGYVAPE